MSAYYNEIDPHAAAWLRELIKHGHIADGVVDERSIEDVEPADLTGFTQCHFFAGIGGWSYALRLAGWPDDKPVWTGSCPCQPFSAAGKQRGSDDARHLWPAFFHIIRECRPGTVFGEQIAGGAGYAWWDHVAADMEGEGYAAAAADLPASGIGAIHQRHRIFWVGSNTDSHGYKGGINKPIALCAPWGQEQFARLAQESVRLSRPSGKAGLLDDGLSRSLAGFGNAIVPQIAAAFVRAAA